MSTQHTNGRQLLSRAETFERDRQIDITLMQVVIAADGVLEAAPNGDLMPSLSELLGDIPPNAVVNALHRGVEAKTLGYGIGPPKPGSVSRPVIRVTLRDMVEHDA